MPVVLSADPLIALVGWRATEERWQTFWNHWSNGRILPMHWLKRDLAPFRIRWFGGELELDLIYERGTLTVPDKWALCGMRLIAHAGRSQSLEWGWEINPAEVDLVTFEQGLGIVARRYADGASFFLSRKDGTELAVQMDWLAGHAGPLRSISIASMGAAKG